MNALSRMWLNSRFPSEPIVIKDAIIPVYLEVAILISFRLYKITFGGKHVQSAVKIVLPIGEPFKIVRCRPVGGALASRLQYPGVYEVGEDGIQVLLELMPFAYLSADLLEAKPIIDGLQEKIVAFIKFLAVIIQRPVDMKGNQDSPGLLPFLYFSVSSLACSSAHAITPSRSVPRASESALRVPSFRILLEVLLPLLSM